MASDNLIEAARRFPSLCYILITELEENEINIKYELYLTANQSLDHFPVISASGFYQINKYTFSVICSTIATYTLVVIQIELAFIK